MADNLWTSPTKKVTLSHECPFKEEQNIRSPAFGKNNKWKLYLWEQMIVQEAFGKYWH